METMIFGLVAECGACNGTGLYSGFMEEKGNATICTNCKGSGAVTLSFKKYTGRKKKNGIGKIRHPESSSSSPRWISYQEFETIVPPFIV